MDEAARRRGSCAPASRWADSFRPNALDWFDRQMEALADFDVTVTFCFTPEHLGRRAAPHQPAARAAGVRRFLRLDDRALCPARSPRAPPHGERLKDRARCKPPTAPRDQRRHRRRRQLRELAGAGPRALPRGRATSTIGPDALGPRRLSPGDIRVVAAWDVDRRKVGPRRRRGDLRQAQLHHRLLRRGASRPARRCAWAACSTASPSTWPTIPSDRTFLLADAARAGPGRGGRGAARDAAPTC